MEAIRLFFKSYWRIILSLAAAGVFFFIAHHLLYIVLTVSSQIKITAEIDHPDIFQVYFSGIDNRALFEEDNSFRSAQVPENRKSEVKIRMNDASVRNVRIDPGDKPGTVKIYEMTVSSHFSEPRVIGPEELMHFFRPGKADVSISLEKDYLKVVSREDDPYLIGTGSLVIINPVLPNTVAILFTVLFCVLFYRFDFSSFPAFYDIRRKKPSIGSNIDALDGLRGLAAMMVVAEHTYGTVNGIGITGVWLFMTLSGFLIARPLVQNPEKALSFVYWKNFFIRRFKRIAPIYYAYITVVFVVPGHFDEALRHFFFLQGDGVLWVINQEIVFYLLTPFIMLVNVVLFRGRAWPIMIHLTLLMFLSYYFAGPSVFSMYGMNHQPLRLYIGIFLAGIIFSYLYYGVFQYSGLAGKLPASNVRFLSWLGMAILIGFMLGSTGKMWGGNMIWSIVYDQWFGIAAALLIFCVAASRNFALGKVLGFFPMRAIGLVSLSMYIIHPLLIQVIRKGASHYYGLSVSGLSLFVFTLLATYMVSCMTYTYIERPFTRI